MCHVRATQRDDSARHETWTHRIAMRSLWKIWIEAKTEEKALRVSERVRRILGGEADGQDVEPYPKIAGFLLRSWVELGGEAWNDCVIEVIEMGQRIGQEWILSGDVRNDPSGWSNKPGIPGVKAIEWSLINESMPTKAETVGP